MPSGKHTISAEFDDFGWSRLSAEAERQGVSVEELLAHAAIYYLSDLDSGRIAARVPKALDADPLERPTGSDRR